MAALVWPLVPSWFPHAFLTPFAPPGCPPPGSGLVLVVQMLRSRCHPRSWRGWTTRAYVRCMRPNWLRHRQQQHQHERTFQTWWRDMLRLRSARLLPRLMRVRPKSRRKASSSEGALDLVALLLLRLTLLCTGLYPGRLCAVVRDVSLGVVYMSMCVYVLCCVFIEPSVRMWVPASQLTPLECNGDICSARGVGRYSIFGSDGFRPDSWQGLHRCNPQAWLDSALAEKFNSSSNAAQLSPAVTCV